MNTNGNLYTRNSHICVLKSAYFSIIIHHLSIRVIPNPSTQKSPSCRRKLDQRMRKQMTGNASSAPFTFHIFYPFESWESCSLYPPLSVTRYTITEVSLDNDDNELPVTKPIYAQILKPHTTIYSNNWIKFKDRALSDEGLYFQIIKDFYTQKFNNSNPMLFISRFI